MEEHYYYAGCLHCVNEVIELLREYQETHNDECLAKATVILLTERNVLVLLLQAH